MLELTTSPLRRSAEVPLGTAYERSRSSQGRTDPEYRLSLRGVGGRQPAGDCAGSSTSMQAPGVSVFPLSAPTRLDKRVARRYFNWPPRLICVPHDVDRWQRAGVGAAIGCFQDVVGDFAKDGGIREDVVDNAQLTADIVGLDVNIVRASN